MLTSDVVGDLRVCPRPMITHLSWSLLELYGYYQDRVLPFSGGIWDQPHPYCEAMKIIGSEIARSKPKD